MTSLSGRSKGLLGVLTLGPVRATGVEQSGGVGSTRRALLGMAILMTFSRAAVADPTSIICNYDPQYTTYPTLTIDLDEAKNTVTVNMSVQNMGDGMPPVPASSTGPLAAKFDSKTITFDWNVVRDNGSKTYVHYTIDRLTGILMYYASDNAPWDQAATNDRAMYRLTCHVGKAQF